MLVIGFAVNALIGGDEPSSKVDTVKFVGPDRSEGIAPTAGPVAVSKAAGEVRALLDAWYQQAFADPAQYGDGSFDDIAKVFTGEAAIGFVEDREVLTIGSFGPRIHRVRVLSNQAQVTVYSEDGTISHAAASVRFEGRARLNDAEHPVLIKQRVDLVLEKRTDESWVITNYYNAAQKRTSAPPDGGPQ